MVGGGTAAAWVEVAVFPKATKGLWSQFRACVRVCCSVHGRCQQWGRRDGRWWSPRTYERQCLRPCMEPWGLDILVSRRHSTASVKVSTRFPVGAPMERVAVDVVGPLPRSDRGHHYVLSAIDYFTKWPEAYALPDQEVETVVDALVEGMFSWFGVQETIHSDQERNFESWVFASMCEHLGMQTSAPGAHGVSLCSAGDLILYTSTPHAEKRAPHPSRDDVWSAA
ncbi:hypothetical protein LDENG_00063050 [Lucifuga dentata]|nr:hypothetical protein LDENG_00063050 [Lucifuga dentata]